MDESLESSFEFQCTMITSSKCIKRIKRKNLLLIVKVCIYELSQFLTKHGLSFWVFLCFDYRESLENCITDAKIRSLKDLPMAKFEKTIWEDFGEKCIYDQSDRQLVNIVFQWRIHYFYSIVHFLRFLQCLNIPY